MALISTGTTISFATSGFALDIVDFDGFEFERPYWDTTIMAEVAINNSDQTFGGMFAQPGSLAMSRLAFTAHWDPTSDPPINAGAEVVTITWPDGTTWTIGQAGSTLIGGFLTRFEVEARLEQIMLVSCEVQFSGVWVSSA